MNIIIAGNGKVGRLLTDQLSGEGHNITVIDKRPKISENSVERNDVISMIGNAASMQVLKDAEIEQADLLITTTGSDEVNLLCCMTAHHINPKIHTIARIRNLDYEDSVYSMQKDLGLSLFVNPEKQTAKEIKHILNYPGFLRRERFANGMVEIVEIRIHSQSILRDQPLYNMEKIVKCKALVCAVSRNGKTIIPSGDFVLQHGDHAFVTASNTNLSTLLTNLSLINKEINKVMIVGGGRIAHHLIESLLKEKKTVKIIENNYDTCEALSLRFPKAHVICADASVHDTLIAENIESYDAFVTLTGIDELNVLLGVYAKEVEVPTVITKLGRAENMEVLSRLPIGSVISPKQLSSDTIIRYVRAIENQKGAAISVHSIANGQAEAIEFKVDNETPHLGEPLKKIKLKNNILISSLTRGKEIIFPDGETTLQAGDRVVVVTCERSKINTLKDIFRK